MILSETLYPHLWEIDRAANSRLEQMIPQMMVEAGATEQLNAKDPMKWVQMMNCIKAQAEEAILSELIHS